MKDLFKKIKPYWIYLAAFLGGAIMPFAFEPYRYNLTAFISPAILLMCLNKRSPFNAFWIGLLYGLGMFGLGVNWVYVSIHDYGYTSTQLAALITLGFVLIISLYPAVLGAILNSMSRKNDMVRCLLIFPALWTAFEILRGWAFTGFPWLYVGYSQMNNHLSALAPIGGVWLVSWAAVLVSAIFYKILDYFYAGKPNKKKRNSLFGAMLAVWMLAFGANQLSWTTPTNNTLSVALVQGNIAQLMRWDPRHFSTILQTYNTLTQQAINADVIVWPEGSIPLPLHKSQAYFKQMGKLATSNRAALFAGVPVELPNGVQYYNAILGVGLAQGIYYKENLVPFGEYVPFEKQLRGLIAFFNLPMSSFVSGPSHQTPLKARGFDINSTTTFSFAPLVCYEIAYPIFVQHLSKHADFILTISNDTWFGTSIGPAQHLQIAQFRALEIGKSVIRATNTGLTAIINPDGKLQALAPQFQATVLNGEITAMQGATPWSRFGIWPLGALLAAALGIGWVLSKRK